MKYSFLDLAYEVLENAEVPLSFTEIWGIAGEKGLIDKLNSSGKTPIASLSAQVYVDAKRGKSRFYFSSKKPSKVWLKAREFELGSEKIEQAIEAKERQDKRENKKQEFNERDLHPLLVKFVAESEEFGLYCKTIYHENSKRQRKGVNQWIHPDIVGVHFPFDFHPQTAEFLKNLSQTPYELYSFELKTHLDFSNLREYYFQAVSNSSWANEGYLVTLECDESGEFIDELWRLNNAFGIGVIKLDASHLLDSQILIPAKNREKLDFDTIDLLVGENPDFKSFIESINHNMKVAVSDYIIEKSFDEVLDDEAMDQYIKNKKIKE